MRYLVDFPAPGINENARDEKTGAPIVIYHAPGSSEELDQARYDLLKAYCTVRETILEAADKASMEAGSDGEDEEEDKVDESSQVQVGSELLVRGNNESKKKFAARVDAARKELEEVNKATTPSMGTDPVKEE